MEGSPKLNILGIAEIVLNVNDLPRLRDFYIENLGFSLSGEVSSEDPADPNQTGEPTICFLKVADSETPLGRAVHPPFLVLIDYKRHAAAKQRFTQLDQTKSAFNHMAFEIAPEDYDGWLAKLKASGIEPFETEFENVQAKAMFIKDPEGNSVELICHQPPTA
jgi:catechol-2,3-dioxygenase